jgi:hypothetical protein
MLGGAEAKISFFDSFQYSLLPHEFEYCHHAKQLHLLAFLCFYCEQRILSPPQAQHSTAHC